MLVPPSVFSLAKGINPDSGRYVLDAIRFERSPTSGPLAIVTDGRVIMICTWDEDKPKEYPKIPLDPSAREGSVTMFPRAHCKDAQGLPPKKTPKAILKNVALEELVPEEEEEGEEEGEKDPLDPREFSYGASDLENTSIRKVKELTGRYPQWRNHLPVLTESNSVSVQLDLDRLLALLQAIKATVGKEQKVTVTFKLDPLSGERKVPMASRARDNVVSLSCVTEEGIKLYAEIMPFEKHEDRGRGKPRLPAWVPEVVE